MSVFKITKKKAIEINQENQPITDEAKAQSEKIDAVNTINSPRAREDDAAAPGDLAPAPAESDTLPIKEGDPARDITVKIDGPVGKVFTDALNQMLAIEGFAAMISPDEVVKKASEAHDHADISIGVYSGSVDLLNTEEIVKISNEITRHSNQEYIIAIEGVRGGHLETSKIRALGILEELTKSSGAKLFYSHDLAISHLRGKLQ